MSYSCVLSLVVLQEVLKEMNRCGKDDVIVMGIVVDRYVMMIMMVIVVGDVISGI